VKNWSGKRDSNSRPQPWQGCALPAELFPPQVEWHSTERLFSVKQVYDNLLNFFSLIILWRFLDQKMVKKRSDYSASGLSCIFACANNGQVTLR
jgi:hypothetical protein